MKRLWLGMIAITCVGCNFEWSVVEPSGVVEDALLAETARHAAMLKVKVRGEIADKLSPVQIEAVRATGATPAGWYEAGVAYYYRPMLHRVSLEEATNVAAHEVCHAVSFFHDLKHWECMASVAVPTYGRP